MEINLLELFGVAEGEVFRCRNTHTGTESDDLKIEKNTLKIFQKCSECWFVSDLQINTLNRIEVIRLPFEPEYGDKYCYPSFLENCGYRFHLNYNRDLDKRIAKNVGIYRTPEEAIAKARELGWVE